MDVACLRTRGLDLRIQDVGWVSDVPSTSKSSKDTVSTVDLFLFWWHLLHIEMSEGPSETSGAHTTRGLTSAVQYLQLQSARSDLSEMQSSAKHQLLRSEFQVNYLSARVCGRRSTPRCYHSSKSNQDIGLWDFLRLRNLLRHNLFSWLLLKASLMNFSIKQQLQILARLLQAVAGQASAQWLRCFLLFETLLKQYLSRDLVHSWFWMILTFLSVCLCIGNCATMIFLYLSAHWWKAWAFHLQSWVLSELLAWHLELRRTELKSSTTCVWRSPKLYAAAWSPSGCRCLCPGVALQFVLVLWSCGAMSSFRCLPWPRQSQWGWACHSKCRSHTCRSKIRSARCLNSESIGQLASVGTITKSNKIVWCWEGAKFWDRHGANSSILQNQEHP